MRSFSVSGIGATASIICAGISVASLPFGEQWINHRLPGLRDFDATYSETPLASVPRVKPPVNLSWLTPIDPRIEAAQHKQELEWRKFAPSRENTPQEEAEWQAALEEGRRDWDRKIQKILKSADQCGVTLPPDFIQLVQSSDLMDRIVALSPTGCYFDLSEDIGPDPFGFGGHLLRIYSDSQFCVLWYLYIPRGGGSNVLAWFPNREVDYLEKAQGERQVKAALSATTLAAHDFTEFVYRLWLEGSLYFKLKYKIPLDRAEMDYVDAIRGS